MQRARRLVLLLAAAAVCVAAGGQVRAASGYDGACREAAGVTVVVDAQELSSAAPATRCAPQAGGNGMEILTQAGVSYDTVGGGGAFVCRIAGLPESEDCQDTPPADAYWSYWLAPRGGGWCLSNKGASYRRPPAGTVEGWSFAKGRQDSGPVPPRTSPPEPAQGTAAGTLARGDCDATSPTGDTTTTAPQPSGAAPATTSTTAPAPRLGATTTTRRSATGPTTSSAPAAAAVTSDPTASSSSSPTSMADASTASTSSAGVLEQAKGPPVTLDVSPERGGGGAGRVAGAGVVIGGLLAAAAAVTARRRRAPRADESLL